MKELIHYIVDSCGHKNNVGKTVLYKILYFSDFDYFELNEKSITNETYKKYPNGPVPVHFEEFKEELVSEMKINEKVKEVFPGSKHNQFNYSSIKPLKIKYLHKDELKIVKNVIDKLSDMSANEISDYSHFDMPWRAATDYDNLKYELVFYRNEPYSVRDN
ncbi:MAG: SocA family protein [Methanobrevibacter sp.]|jgi:uncharacterized phage-associated protein|nr:SocA family protein [Candidatus Methanovirga australis]